MRKSRLSPRKQGRLIEPFVAGSTDRAAAELTGVQANTAIRFFMGLRRLISSKLPSFELSGEVEADESYFGGRRKGKRGRGTAGKVAVFRGARLDRHRYGGLGHWESECRGHRVKGKPTSEGWATCSRIGVDSDDVGSCII